MVVSIAILGGVHHLLNQIKKSIKTTNCLLSSVLKELQDGNEKKAISDCRSRDLLTEIRDRPGVINLENIARDVNEIVRKVNRQE